MKIFYSILIILFCSATITSCQNEMKFDKAHWNQKEDLNTYPYRAKMVHDLLDNHKVKGLHYSELVELLGRENSSETDFRTLFYDITTQYGSNIDPVSSENLMIELDKNNVVTNFKLIKEKN